MLKLFCTLKRNQLNMPHKLIRLQGCIHLCLYMTFCYRNSVLPIVQVSSKPTANGTAASPLRSYINFQILESPTTVPDGAAELTDSNKVKRTPSLQRDDHDIQRIQHRAEKLGYKVSTV